MAIFRRDRRARARRKATPGTTPRTARGRARPPPAAKSASLGDEWRALVFKLAIAADGHIPTMAGVLGTTPQSVGARLHGRALGSQWLRARAVLRRSEALAVKRRWWWRERLRAIGVDPHALPITDPLWSACHRRPRGALVRDAALELRAEHPGETIATTERLTELLARVVARAALDESARRAAHRAACARVGVDAHEI